jgi:hypothetical protein
MEGPPGSSKVEAGRLEYGENGCGHLQHQPGHDHVGGGHGEDLASTQFPEEIRNGRTL